MKKIIIITVITAILFSCKKKVVDGTFTIKGHLYEDCNKAPIRYSIVTLNSHYYENSRPKYVTLAKDTTDVTGYFEFSYSNPVDEADIFISSEMGIYPGYLSFIPFENIENLEVISNAKSSVKVKLSVVKNYTNADTLFIIASGSTNGNYKVAGPFTNEQTINLFNYSLYNSEYLYYRKSTFSYRIGKVGSYTDTTINIVPCKNDSLNIEIK